ncbi:MAG TPA: hypothetical protein VFU02_06545 [Polyangiaceae bacterium]|nr:hypothetical protein [Polyangiaceae bacterium]
MNLRSYSWIAVTVVAAGGALSYVHLSDKWAGELTKLKREISEVKRGQSSGPAVIREVQVVAASENATGDAPALAPAPSSAPPPELTAEEQAQLEAKRQKIAQARVSLLQQEHASEPEDAEWSHAAEAKIAALYSAPEFQSLRVTAACKYTLCRLDIAYVDAQEGPLAFQKFMETRPWSGRRFTHLDLERGEGSAYLVREGFSLPTLDPKSIEN